MEFEAILKEKDEIIETLNLKNADMTPLRERSDVINF